MANYLIIGGSSGIGQALVKDLTEKGHQLSVSYKTGEHLEIIPKVNYFEYDVNLPLHENIDLPDKLDGFVYCPGGIDLKPFKRMSPESFLEDYNVQVLGAVRSLQGALPRLLKADNPSVLFFSSVAAQSGFPFHTKVSASKGAIEGLTKSLAAEYATKIRVNAIAPSLTDTPMANHLLSTPEKKSANAKRNPMQKVGEPKDVARVAAFLLSENSSWMTGQIVNVDGGMTNLIVG